MPRSKNPKSLIILGVDPGLADTGFGLIKKDGSRLTVLDYGCIKTHPSQAMANRLKEIYQALNRLVKNYHPQVVAIEKLFFAKNAKTALVVGQARGVAILATGQNQLIIKEFTPLQVKLALTSYGQASKKQVAEMVKIILRLPRPPKSDD